MGHPLRQFAAHEVWFLTARCFQARMLMTPYSPLVREVCGGVLARAAARYCVELYAYAFLSNHLHLVVRTKGSSTAAFMQYLLGNLAKKLSPLCREPWWGKFWERRYTATPILDDASLEDRVRYVVAHGVKEGLVSRTIDWAGLHCSEQLQDGAPRTFAWFDWTKRWATRDRSGAPMAARWEPDNARLETLRIAPLPHWAGLPDDVRRRNARELVQSVERQHAGLPVLGMKAVAQEPLAARRQRKRAPRPWCHAATAEGHRRHREAYRDFLAAYRQASSDWRAGDLEAAFPLGCFRPGLPHPTNVNPGAG